MFRGKKTLLQTIKRSSSLLKWGDTLPKEKRLEVDHDLEPKVGIQI